MTVSHLNKSVFEVAAGSNPAVCVTTNGIVKSDGMAVMGAGIAKECARLFPDIPIELGKKINAYGSKVYNLGIHTYSAGGRTVRYSVISFPTKYHWKDRSDIDLIRESCLQLVELTDMYEFDKVWLPAPGCNNGKLNWERDVRPVVEPLLDGRFIICIADF